jgi:YHS domain-containing protein
MPAIGNMPESEFTRLSTHDRSLIMTSTTIDPVCGMSVEPEEAAAESQYQGQTYYFCCKDCKRIFDEDPMSYVSEQTADYATQN